METVHNNSDITHSNSMETVHNNNNVTDRNSIEMVVTGDHVLDSSDDHSPEGIEQTVHTEAAEQTVHTADDSLVGLKTGKDLNDGHLIQIKASNSEVKNLKFLNFQTQENIAVINVKFE